MNELRRGTQITGAFIKQVFAKMFNKINLIDYSQITATTGQFIRFDISDVPCDLPAVYSDQYYKTDIIPDQYAGENVSYLQKYLDEVQSILEED